MTTTTQPLPDRQPGEVEPAERGSLTVADRVVERVAGYAVTLVEDAAAAPRRVLGVKVSEADPERAPNVTARVLGATAVIEATIAVRWPQPVGQVADQVRRRVREEVEGITGVQVDHVDVEVAGTQVPEPSARRLS